MPSLRNEISRNKMIQRLNCLTSDAKPRWGKLDAPRMICHLDDGLGMALGYILPSSLHVSAVRRSLIKFLILYVMRMPRNVPTAPELLSCAPGNFNADRQRVIERIEKLAATPNAIGPEHPFFGALTNDEWNILQWKHADHHLRQFGC